MRASQGTGAGTLADFFWQRGTKKSRGGRKLVVTRAGLGGSREPDIFFKGRTQDGRKNHFAGVLRAQGHGSAGQREGEKRAFSGSY